MKRKFLILCVFLTSCGHPRFEEQTEHTFPLNPDATLRVRNRDGAIRVYGSDAPELTVEVLKKAYSLERLHQINAKISVRADAAVIDTIFPPDPRGVSAGDRSGTVDYTIVVPQTCRIEALDLENGEIMIEGIRESKVNAKLRNGLLYCRNDFSDLHVSVETGNVDLLFEWWEQKKFRASAETTNGNIRVGLPSEVSLDLDAEARTGNIRSGFDEPGTEHPGPPTQLKTKLGDANGASLTLRTLNGNIRIDELP